MTRPLYKEEELLNYIDHWCNELNQAPYNSEQYNNALTELNYYKILLQKAVRKRAKKRAKAAKSKKG
jgi:hypothetical protein